MRQIDKVFEMVGKLFADIPLVKLPAGMFGAVIAWILPEQAMRDAAVGAFVVILLDTVTGVAAVKNTGEAVTSAKFGRVLVKLLGYFSVVAVVAAAGHSIPGMAVMQPTIVTGVLTTIVATEGISVLENVTKMGLSVPFGLDKWLRDRIPQLPVSPPDKGQGNEYETK